MATGIGLQKHSLDDKLCQKNRCGYIDVYDLPDSIRCGVCQQIILANGGIVDKSIYRTEFICNSTDKGLQGPFIGGIELLEQIIVFPLTRQLLRVFCTMARKRREPIAVAQQFPDEMQPEPRDPPLRMIVRPDVFNFCLQ